MKVVCIDTDFNGTSYGRFVPGLNSQLEWGKVYEASFIFYDEDSKQGIKLIGALPVEWDKNFLNLEGFSEADWFPTKNFVTLDVWRQKVLNELIS